MTRCSLLVEIHSLLVTRCKITRCLLETLLATRCWSCSFHKISRYSLQNSLVTRCRSCYLQKITRCSLQNSLDTQCKKAFFVRTITPWNYCLFKVNKVTESFSFFNIICFLRPKNSKLFKATYYPGTCCYQNIV